MHFSTVLTTFALASATLNTCGERQRRICFDSDGGDSQDVTEEEFLYAASVVRNWIKGLAVEFDNAFSKNKYLPSLGAHPAGDLQCGQWKIDIPKAGTVPVLIEHTSGRDNSSVLFDDVANTIDGGLDPTSTTLQNSVLGCGINGGMIRVQHNSSNPIYKSEKYLATKAMPENLIMKVLMPKI